MFRREDIKFEKGDTLGGTAPLIMLNQVRAGQAGRRFSRRRRDNRFLRALSTVFTVLLLAGAGLAVLALSWEEIWRRLAAL